MRVQLFRTLQTLFICTALCPPSWAQDGSTVLKSEKHTFRVATMVTGLVNPWSVAFLPDGRMLVTELAGRLRLVGQGFQLDPKPIEGLPELVAQGQGGAATPAVDDGRSLLAIINDAASAHGIAAGLKRVTPLSERNLTLGFEDVAYAGVMQWLQEMVAQRGARIERLSMERRDKPGIVTTEMTLTFP